MSNAAGSYAFESDPDKKIELERLKKQAAMAAPVERQILNATGLQQGMHALDIGCGPGFVSIEMAKIVGDQGQVLGVDISETLLQTARSYAADTELKNTRFQQGSVYELDVPAATRDYAYARFFVQHLEHPLPALQQIGNTLKPGGKICIVDIDDQWLSLYPEPAGFAAFNERAIAGQHANGGDRYVGRKLGHYLQQAGFDACSMQIIPVTSNDIGMEAFMEIAISPRWKFTPAEHREAAFEQYQAFRQQMLDNPQAWGMLALFVASASKV